FLPGDRVLFAEDFSHDKAGDFPRRLELKAGNLDIAEWQGQNFLRATDHGSVMIPLPEVLPQRFTFEADYNGGRGAGWMIAVQFADGSSNELTTAHFTPSSGGLDGGGVNSESEIPEGSGQQLTHIAVMADGKYVK